MMKAEQTELTEGRGRGLGNRQTDDTETDRQTSRNSHSGLHRAMHF